MFVALKKVDCFKHYIGGPHQETVQQLRTGLGKTAVLHGIHAVMSSALFLYC